MAELEKATSKTSFLLMDRMELKMNGKKRLMY